MPIHPFKLFHLDICAALSLSKGEMNLNFPKKDIDLLPVYRLVFLIIIYNYWALCNYWDWEFIIRSYNLESKVSESV